MLDCYLEPDDDIEYRCECGECVACLNDWEWGIKDEDDEPTEAEIAVAEFNYECLVYREPERRIAWRS